MSIKGLYTLPQGQTQLYDSPAKPDIKSGGGMDTSETRVDFIPRCLQIGAHPTGPGYKKHICITQLNSCAQLSPSRGFIMAL